ncbi:hypothetical protein NM208_g12217 [Fusarium decemcellulare]|uniref:Uncharacterized protein n=1 Tax=Fusarium decemcellulare TaxID=57161 RepID=A0ACC1RPH6_9HYPO|nr:hypothetical protein NM208_g12217 [Fusarium decemcellulare]
MGISRAVLFLLGATSAAVLQFLDTCAYGETVSPLSERGADSNEDSTAILRCSLPVPVDVYTWVTLLAISQYCISMGIFYHLQRHKRYVDAYLVGGVTLGLMVGFAMGFSPQAILFQLMPGTALVALVLSDLHPCTKA